MPDIVANLRVDQAWGSAQIMGALHNVGGGYYGHRRRRHLRAGCWRSGNTCSGHPDDKFGWAVGAGIKINFPMIGPGDYFQAQVNYTQGAVTLRGSDPGGCRRRLASSAAAKDRPWRGLVPGWRVLRRELAAAAANVAGPVCPAGGSTVELTTAWSVQAAYEHFWTPSLRTSLVGAYTDISYNGDGSAP